MSAENIAALRQYYIIRGIGRVGNNVAHELATTERPYVPNESDKEAIARYRERYPDALWTHADSGEDSAVR